MIKAMHIAKTMKGVSPVQMERMLVFADYVKKINLYYKKIKQFILSKAMVIVALLILLVAIVLRIFNIT